MTTFPAEDILGRLREQNKEWVKKMNEEHPNFFPGSAGAQFPKVLWIGCSDSRVPESVILGCLPGEIFTHRNIANLVKPTFPHHPVNELPPNDDIDPNSDSVLTFAVTQMGVRHIIVAGHTRCGGVAACLLKDSTDKSLAFNPAKTKCGQKEPQEEQTWDRLPLSMRRWLAPVRSLAESLPDDTTVLELVKQNVQKQVLNVVRSAVVQDNWFGEGKGDLIGVHGWLYRLETGDAEDLGYSITGETPRDSYFK